MNNKKYGTGNEQLTGHVQVTKWSAVSFDYCTVWLSKN